MSEDWDALDINLLDPLGLVQVFLGALSDRHANAGALGYLVTPESRDDWGDFGDASRLVDGIHDLGYGSVAARAADDDQVAYVKLLSGVTQTYRQVGDSSILAAAIITLVWRQDHSRWMVHHLGDYVRPENVPRAP